MIGHDCAPPIVCACDQDVRVCPCPCYRCHVFRVDAQARDTLGALYTPAKMAAAALAWVMGWWRPRG